MVWLLFVWALVAIENLPSPNEIQNTPLLQSIVATKLEKQILEESVTSLEDKL